MSCWRRGGPLPATAIDQPLDRGDRAQGAPPRSAGRSRIPLHHPAGNLAGLPALVLPCGFAETCRWPCKWWRAVFGEPAAGRRQGVSARTDCISGGRRGVVADDFSAAVDCSRARQGVGFAISRNGGGRVGPYRLRAQPGRWPRGSVRGRSREKLSQLGGMLYIAAALGRRARREEQEAAVHQYGGFRVEA